MTETGRIRETRGNLAIIVPEKSSACFGCMNLECRSGGGTITAENPKNLPISVSQIVEVETSGIAGQALTAFLPPILGFMAGFVSIRLFFPETGEGAAAFTGIFLLFASAFAVYRVRKKFPAKNKFFITKIMD